MTWEGLLWTGSLLWTGRADGRWVGEAPGVRAEVSGSGRWWVEISGTRDQDSGWVPPGRTPAGDGMRAAEQAAQDLLDRAILDPLYADRYPAEIAYDFVRELPRLPADASGLEGAVVTAGDTTPRGEVLFRICEISEGLASIRSIGPRASCYSTVKPVGRLRLFAACTAAGPVIDS